MSDDLTTRLHGTCVDIDGAGVLLLGAPGSGKSDLALRLIDTSGHGAGGRGVGKRGLVARLVADDQLVLSGDGETLYAASPPRTAGLIEVRGVGIIAVPHVERAAVALAIELAGSHGAVERHPDLSAQHREWAGISVPVLSLYPFEVSAPAKVRAAVTALRDGTLREMVPGNDATAT